MSKQKTIKGLTIDYNGQTISNIIHLYIDCYEGNSVSFSYYEGQDTRINVQCKLNDVKISIN